jgi:hypothetical protein
LQHWEVAVKEGPVVIPSKYDRNILLDYPASHNQWACSPILLCLMARVSRDFAHTRALRQRHC